MPDELDFAEMLNVITGRGQQARPALAQPAQQVGFGPLMAILMEQAKRAQQPVQQDPRYLAGYQAADDFLRRQGR